jgi:hypothetical protein
MLVEMPYDFGGSTGCGTEQSIWQGAAEITAESKERAAERVR